MLSTEQRRFYEEKGYLYPLRVFSDRETRYSAGNSTTTQKRTESVWAS
jgi:hypothetical protein